MKKILTVIGAMAAIGTGVYLSTNSSIEIPEWPVITKVDKWNWRIDYPNEFVKTNWYWYVEESANLIQWWPVLYDDSVSNIPLVWMGDSTYIRLVGVAKTNEQPISPGS